MNPLATILAAVSVETGVSVDHIMSRRRTDRISRARFQVYRRLRDLGWNLSEIGRQMGRDHSTITHGLKRAKEQA